MLTKLQRHHTGRALSFRREPSDASSPNFDVGDEIIAD
jgi:hypothetical protein